MWIFRLILAISLAVFIVPALKSGASQVAPSYAAAAGRSVAMDRATAFSQPSARGGFQNANLILKTDQKDPQARYLAKFAFFIVLFILSMTTFGLAPVWAGAYLHHKEEGLAAPRVFLVQSFRWIGGAFLWVFVTTGGAAWFVGVPRDVALAFKIPSIYVATLFATAGACCFVLLFMREAMARLRDAGLSPWWAGLIMVPGVNLLTYVALLFWPSKKAEGAVQ